MSNDMDKTGIEFHPMRHGGDDFENLDPKMNAV